MTSLIRILIQRYFFLMVFTTLDKVNFICLLLRVWHCSVLCIWFCFCKCLLKYVWWIVLLRILIQIYFYAFFFLWSMQLYLHFIRWTMMSWVVCDHIMKNGVYFFDVCLFCFCYSQVHLSLIAAPYSISIQGAVICIFAAQRQISFYSFMAMWIYFCTTGGTHKTETNCKWYFNTVSRAFFSWISIAPGSWDSPSTQQWQVNVACTCVFSRHFTK